MGMEHGTTEEFFRGMTEQMRTCFDQRIQAETDEIRRAYDTSLERERQGWKEKLLAIGEQLGEATEDVNILQDAAKLNREIVRYLRKAPTEATPYSIAMAMTLQELTNSVASLSEHCSNHFSSMSFQFSPKGLTGKEYPLTVRPAVDKVEDVKQKIRSEYCKTCEVKLCTSDGHIVMEDSKLLMHYNLDQEFSVVLVDVLNANGLVHLPLVESKGLAFEEVSGGMGTIMNSECVEAVNVHGKEGVNLTDYGCLVLPKTIQLRDGWTISCWILAEQPSTRNRHLLDGTYAHELIAVALSRGRLKNFAEGNYLRGFNVSSLSEGWHHLAVVGHNNFTTYYMDGKRLGQKYGMATGTIGVVGNSKTSRNAWGHLADFHIFGIAADPLQIEGLFNAGGGCVSDGDSWQDSVVKQNVDSDSVSSYSSLQSYMDSDISEES